MDKQVVIQNREALFDLCSKINLALLNNGYSSYIRLDYQADLGSQVWLYDIKSNQRIKKWSPCLEGGRLYDWLWGAFRGLNMGLEINPLTTVITTKQLSPRQVEQIAKRVVSEAIDGMVSQRDKGREDNACSV